MRTCGSCGETGHNRRTCEKTAPVASAPTAATPTTATLRVASPVKSTAVGIGSVVFDAETQEAIDWYLEKNNPGHMARKLARLSKSEHDDETEE